MPDGIIYNRAKCSLVTKNALLLGKYMPTNLQKKQKKERRGRSFIELAALVVIYMALRYICGLSVALPRVDGIKQQHIA